MVAIVSDSHDHLKNLSRACEIASERGCQVMLFAGDLVAPPTLECFDEFNGPVHMVLGNNEGEIAGLTARVNANPKLTLHGLVQGNSMELELEGKKIFMNHYPKLARLAAESGNYDICIHGHDHLYNVEKVATTLLINPGEVQGQRTKIPSFAIINLSTMEVERINL